jgi:hypothetical protein
MLTGFDPDRRSAIGGKLSGETARAEGAADRWLPAAMNVLLIALVLHALGVLWLGLFQPIIDKHAFRQTQTALSAYWLWKGGPWLAYETPILGSPWSIPFEFPLYQYLVALLRLAGIPIDIGGRLVSFGFYLGCLWPLRLLFQAQRLGRFSYLAVAILFLSSPLYLFWGRTVMIESCALFFGLLWLALLADFLSRPRPAALLWTVLAGTAAALVKLTRFPAFLLLGGALLIHHALRDGLSQPHRRTLALALAGFVIPLIFGYAWVAYSDAVKQQNPFGALLTSAGLWTWNFGSWAQRWSSALWLRTVLQRALPDDFGYGVPLAITFAGIALASRRFAGPAIAALLAFLAPFLVFTNLYLQHDYYQVANALFVIAAVGLGIASVASAGYCRTAAAGLVLLVGLQLAYFWRRDAPLLTADLTGGSQIRIARMAGEQTPPGSALIVIGDDWSSEVPYYAERKALAMPYWATARPILKKLLADPQSFLGDRPLGGIVYCASAKVPADIAPQIAAFTAGRKLLGTASDCQLLSAQR